MSEANQPTIASGKYFGPRPIVLVPGPELGPVPTTVAPVVMQSTALLECVHEYNRLLEEKGELGLYLGPALEEEEVKALSPQTWYAILDHPNALRNLLIVRRAEVDKTVDTLLECLGDCRRGVGEAGKAKADVAICQFLHLLSQVTGSEILRHIVGLYDTVSRTSAAITAPPTDPI